MVAKSVVEDFLKAIQPADKNTDHTYNATVTRVDKDGVVWVQVAGSDKETPTSSTSSEVKRGDAVNVQWRNNKLYVAGNYTNPSAGSVRVRAVEVAAQVANQAASNAVADAGVARQAAESAQSDAARAKSAADGASEYAARAFGNLSTVQSITETLTWITQHGTMALTTDVALDPTHVYFVQDAGGDYVVGGVTYAVVTEPDVADIGTYYELSIDESLNNYVGTHLALTSEGLWLVPEAGGNKVLIATGGVGHTYEDAGTYIIDGSDNVLAQFGTSGVQIGQTGESHLDVDYRSISLTDNDGVYFNIADKRDKNGYIHIGYTGDGVTTDYVIGFYAVSIQKVTIDDVATTAYTLPVTRNKIIFTTPPAGGSTIEIVAKPNNGDIYKDFTLGSRKDGQKYGLFSFVVGYENEASGTVSYAQGEETVASGDRSHSEGLHSIASGDYAHAESFYTEASGASSHAQNIGTKASCKAQSVIGTYNEVDTYPINPIHPDRDVSHGNYALIVGNGKSDTIRSNALTVGWDGDICLALDTTAASGTDHDLYAAINTLGWKSDVIV